MKQRFLALGLASVMALSITVPAGAAWTGGSAPQAAASHTWSVTPIYDSVTFDNLEARMLANNLTIQMMDETIASMEDMNWNAAINDLEDAIDDMESAIGKLDTSGNSVKLALGKLGEDLAALSAMISGSSTEFPASLAASIAGVSQATTQTALLASQKITLESTLESLESSLEDLEEQKKDYLEKTLPDTKAQMEDAKRQMIVAAETLYIQALNLEDQLVGLEDTKTAMERTVAEMTLRYERGQISQMTLTQVKNGYSTLVNSIALLEQGLVTMKSNFQALLGDTITGNLTLSPLAIPTESTIGTADYTADLAKAKEASYSLYSAKRSVEDAKEDMEDARKEEGKNSYQYKMAEHTYQGALYSQQAAVNSFELSFLSLYQALAPAQAALVTGKADLDYQQQVYEVAKVKYQQGNLSANKLADAEDTWQAAQRDYTALETDLFTAWNNYRNAVEYGIVGSTGG